MASVVYASLQFAKVVNISVQSVAYIYAAIVRFNVKVASHSFAIIRIAHVIANQVRDFD